jgi:hypothetical protein
MVRDVLQIVKEDEQLRDLPLSVDRLCISKLVGMG